LYGDNYWPLDIEKLLAHHRAHGEVATVTVYERPYSAAKKNNMRVSDGVVQIYDKKRETDGCNGVDIGFFILSRSVLDLIPDANVNFEAAVFPTLIEKKQLVGFLTKHPYWGLTDAARLPSVERALDPARKVLFLDRDGTLNKKAAKAQYITSWDAFEFLPHAQDALGELSQRGYEMYLITNQPGIARGIVREEDVHDIYARLTGMLSEKRIVIAGMYYCPHGWDDKCECRKPAPGMLYAAALEHDIDLTRALFIGDDERDKEAGDAVGARTILVPHEEGVVAALPLLPD